MAERFFAILAEYPALALTPKEKARALRNFKLDCRAYGGKLAEKLLRDSLIADDNKFIDNHN